MRIGILGSGNVGLSLATGFAAQGHDVMIGSRNPQRPELQGRIRAANGKVAAGTVSEAAGHGELVVLATPGTAVEETIDLAGTDHFRGKVVIDATNPLTFTKDGIPGVFVGTTDSLGERVQRKLPRAKVVKAFNTVNRGTMTEPRKRDGVADMLIAGNDARAKETVSGLLRELGWPEPIDVGGIEAAHWLEALVPLRLRLGAKLGTYEVAFKVLRG